MHDHPHHATEAALLAGARSGDPEAVAELYSRHVDEAVRYARRIAGDTHADDLVSESFLKVFRLLAGGRGPVEHFRSYLFTTVKNTSIDLHRRTRAEVTVADDDLPVGVAADSTEDVAEIQLVLAALRQLPPTYRDILWWSEVLDLPQKEIASRLDSNPNAVGALTFRAREALRQAYLAAHVETAARPRCSRVVELLPKYVRGRLGPARTAEVEDHLPGCADCRRALAIMLRENTRLGALLLPLLLVAHHEGWLAAGTAVALQPTLAPVLEPASGQVAPSALAPTTSPWASALVAVGGTSAAVIALAQLASPPAPRTPVPGAAPTSAQPRPDDEPTTAPPAEATDTTSSPAGTPQPPLPSVTSPPTTSLPPTPRATPTWVVSPVHTPSPTATPTPTPTTTPTLSQTTRWTVDWSQLEHRTPLAGRSLVVSGGDGSTPWSVTPSMELTGEEAPGFNFTSGYEGFPGPLPVHGMSPDVVGMILNLHKAGSEARVTLSFSRPVTAVELDVFSLGHVAGAQGFREQLQFSEPVILSGDTTWLNATQGAGPFYRTEPFINLQPVHVSSAFDGPRDSFNFVYSSLEPTGSNAWYYLGVANLELETPP